MKKARQDALEQDALSQTYQDILPLIIRTTNSFITRYGFSGDRESYFEEALSIANSAFVEAYHSFKSDKRCLFTTWVYNTIWYRLKDSKLRPIPKIDYVPPPHTFNFRFSEILTDASQDARLIISLIMDIPNDIQTIILKKRKGKVRGRNIRSGIRKYLLQTGWNRLRFQKAAEEIEQLITE